MQVRVRQNPNLSRLILDRLTLAERELWRQIGDGRLVAELVASESERSELMAALSALQARGAIVLEEEPVIDLATQPLLHVTDDEARLLALDCDLDDAEKRRIIAVHRAVNSGDYFQVLKLPRTASRQELKRAYFAVSKLFHPDRYYQRDIQGFLPLLERIFTATSQFVKTLGDARTMTGASSVNASRNRRRYTRREVRIKAQVRCDSWPESKIAFSHDVSDAGVFMLAADSKAEIGEMVRIVLQGSHDQNLLLKGRVVSSQPAQPRRPAGLGIHFDALTRHYKERLRAIISQALALAVSAEKVESRRLHRRDPIIGIDFGTTNTAVAVAIDDKIQILRWPDGSYAIPSVVAFPKRGQHVVGVPARELVRRNPRNGISSVKRLLGRNYDDKELLVHLSNSGFPHVVGPDGYVVAKFWDEPFAMPQVCSYLFHAVRSLAERNLGVPVTKAVVTVPVSFTAERIALVKRAAKLAHIDVIDVIEEPSAAALANRHQTNFGGTIGVYDFGGGTFDFSLVDASGGDLRVLSTTGDSWLGGDDFDLALADASAELIWKAHQINIRHRAVEWQELVQSCEAAKRVLSRQQSAQVRLVEAIRTSAGVSDILINLERGKIERFWHDPIKRSIDTCLQALALAETSPTQLNAVYLSGGTSRIPLIREALRRRFQAPVIEGVSPEFAVCAGAGIHAAQLERAATTMLPSVG